MVDVIKWDASGLSVRLAVVELVGWCNHKGHVTPTGMRIARTAWDDLSQAVKNILLRHGIVN